MVDTPPTGRGHPYPCPVLTTLFTRVWREAGKFGLVGLFNFVVDAGLFNLLRHTTFENKPLTAKVVSTTVAVISSYFMNRHWTWKDRTRSGLRRELPLFVVLSAIALGISLACLGVSHYVLGYRGALADNIAANGFGLVLGTAFRFWAFKKWVFLATPAGSEPTALEDAVRTSA